MIRFREVVLRVRGCTAADLDRWIALHWVRPEPEEDDWRFAAVDVDRVRLIVTLRHELAIDDDAVPVVLGLLDQLYGLRADFAALAAAVAAQPPPVRRAIHAAVGRRRRADA